MLRVLLPATRGAIPKIYLLQLVIIVNICKYLRSGPQAFQIGHNLKSDIIKRVGVNVGIKSQGLGVRIGLKVSVRVQC